MSTPVELLTGTTSFNSVDALRQDIDLGSAAPHWGRGPGPMSGRVALKTFWICVSIAAERTRHLTVLDVQVGDRQRDDQRRQSRHPAQRAAQLLLAAVKGELAAPEVDPEAVGRRHLAQGQPQGGRVRRRLRRHRRGVAQAELVEPAHLHRQGRSPARARTSSTTAGSPAT